MKTEAKGLNPVLLLKVGHDYDNESHQPLTEWCTVDAGFTKLSKTYLT